MEKINKIVGIGMSKTGTSTLATCLKILSIKSHKSYDRWLEERLINKNDIESVLIEAEKYKSFEDSPWFLVFREMDQRFPHSKFILTVRKDSPTHARSSWFHGVHAGTRVGGPTEKYIQNKIKVYEEHNQAVLDYFQGRPEDLLVQCWEKGDGWPQLCEFLGVDVPGVPFPHANLGGYGKRAGFILEKIENASAYPAYLRLKSRFRRSYSIQWIKRRLTDKD